MRNGQISVVVPCFNEEKTVRKNIKKIAAYLEVRFREFEIIAVNDGSLDGTLGELNQLQKEIPLGIMNYEVNRGKGWAVREGVLASRYDLTMFLDADLGIPIEELGKFIPEVGKGFDIVIASRFVPGFRIIRPVPFHRRVMEKVFRLIRMALINDWDIKDTQCGFKIFRREAAMKIFPKLTVKRFAFDAELIFVAAKHGYKIKELPIHLQNPPSRSLRLFRDPMNMIGDLLKIRLNDWRGKYR